MKSGFEKVIIRPVKAAEDQQWVLLMKKHHYLGFNGVLGERINYVAELNRKWLALLSFACAALKTRERDAWIGWEKEQKVDKRLCFVANNWRFLILPDQRIPNLASHILGKSLRRLSHDWEKKYKHPILMVETFVDASRYKGTCYKADNWIFVGWTQGFQKNHEAYFYHGVKKLIFVKPLVKGAREILGSRWTHPTFLPETARGRITVDINKIQIFGSNGLMEFCGRLKDNRSKHGKRHKSTGLMVLCILGCLAGAKGYKGLFQWGKTLTSNTLWKIKLRAMPSESTIRRFLINLDAGEVDRKLTAWLLATESLNGVALALDGKTLRGSFDGKKKPLQLLSIVSHDSGVILAQEKVHDKTNEIPVAQALLKKLDIKGSIVTADALHSQHETATIIARDKQADYVFTVKNNQRSLRKEIQTALENSAFSPS